MSQKTPIIIISLLTVGLLAALAFLFFSSRQPYPQPLDLNSATPTSSVLPNSDQINSVYLTMQLTSPAFQNQQPIPDKYTCAGKNINPSLTISSVPPDAQSLALIVDDPDAPAGIWDHWLVFNINPSVAEIAEDSLPPGGIQLPNSFGKPAYGGPCPPPGTAHRYFFKLYALDTTLNPDQISSKSDLLSAVKDHSLASSELVGIFSR